MNYRYVSLHNLGAGYTCRGSAETVTNGRQQLWWPCECHRRARASGIYSSAVGTTAAGGETCGGERGARASRAALVN